MHTVSSSIRSKIPHFSVITPSLTLPPQSSDTNVITPPGDIPTRALTISRSQTTTSPTFYMTTSSVGEVGAGGPPIPNPFYPHIHCLPNTFDRYGDGSMCYEIFIKCCSGMEARCCCFCKRRWIDKWNYQRLFGTVSESLLRAIVTNGTEIFAATVDLQEAFEESSVVCRQCRQLFLNFEKKSQEMKALEEPVCPLLLEALSRTESPAVSPIQHTRPPLASETTMD